MKRKIACSFLGILCASALSMQIPLYALGLTGIYTRANTPQAYINITSTNASINKVYYEGKYYSFTGGEYHPEGGNLVLCTFYGGLVYNSIDANSYITQNIITIDGGYDLIEETIEISNFIYYK